MYSTPRKKSRHGDYSASQAEPETPSSIVKRLDKGLFSDGQWWCNCEPRKKMVLLETKKEGPNKGKFFYKCFDCNLFIWWSQARVRETGLEPQSKGPWDADEHVATQPPLQTTPSLTQTPLSAYGYTSSQRQINDQSDDDSGPESAGTGLETPCPSTSKRKRDAFDENDFSDLGSDVEQEMIEIVEKRAQKMRPKQRQQQHQQHQEQQQERQAFATPSNPRSTDVIAGLPTPSVTRTLFPDAKRQKQSSLETNPPSSPTLSRATLGRSTSVTTPGHSSMPPASSPACNIDYNLVNEVLELLQDQEIDPHVLQSVRSVLETADRRARGFVLGRESAKAAVKDRDDKIAALQERIVTLENRERMHRTQLTNIKANLMKVYEEN